MTRDLTNRHELITGYLTGELADEESEAFEAHFFQCEDCFKAVQVAEDAVNLIGHDGPAILTEGSAPRVRKRRHKKSSSSRLLPQQHWGFVAGAAALAIILMIFLIKRNTENEFADLSGPAFEPEPYLEEWVTESTRSGGETIDEVLSPAIGEKFENETVTFRWKMLDQTAVTLKILSNFEEAVFTATPGVSQFPSFTVEVDPGAFEKSGLYYWRLEDEENVLFVGKFYFFKD